MREKPPPARQGTDEHSFPHDPAVPSTMPLFYQRAHHAYLGVAPRSANAWGTPLGNVIDRRMRAVRAHNRHHASSSDVTRGEIIGQ